MPLVNELFEDRDTMFEALTQRILDRLEASIAARGEASLVLSGGGTPVPLFEALSTRELDWSKVIITLADERWVDANHDDSNEKLVRTKLMQNKAVSARFVSLKTAHSQPEDGVDELNQTIGAIARPFDVVLLGMGGDGHTASLFPKGDNLTVAIAGDTGLVASMRAPGAPQPRMTLTLPALIDCKDLILLCTGQGKRDVFQQALGDGPVSDLPIRSVIRQEQTPLVFYWAP